VCGVGLRAERIGARSSIDKARRAERERALILLLLFLSSFIISPTFLKTERSCLVFWYGGGMDIATSLPNLCTFR